MLIVKTHTFIPFDGTTNTVILANKMANHIMHNLRQNKIRLTTIIHHKKIVQRKTTCGEGLMFFDLRGIEPSKPPM